MANSRCIRVYFIKRLVSHSLVNRYLERVGVGEYAVRSVKTNEHVLNGGGENTAARYIRAPGLHHFVIITA